MKKVSLGARLRYAFDNTLSKGPAALIGWLGALSLVIVALGGLILSLFRIAPEGSGPLSFFEGAWESMMRTLDAGTMGGDAGWGYRIVMFGVTIGGVFIISTLIGVLTASVEGKVEEMRKGRSQVLESGHTVILGWSPQVFTIITEIVAANANQRRGAIVVLADKDKVEMEDEIRDRVEELGRTHVICRTGSPMNMADLQLANVDEARSIIILSSESDDPDADVIKMVLAITNNPNRKKGKYHIVAEIRDPKNVDVARMVGRDEVELVQSAVLVSRITAQTCRQSGLSVVYTELLDFGGDEIYFKEEPALAGLTFGETLVKYEDSTVIGLCLRDGGPRLSPPMDTRIGAGDKLIAISQDDDTIKLSGLTDLGIREELIHNSNSARPAPERTLILGWNWRVPMIINELDSYVPAGSEVTVVADCEDGEENLQRFCEVKNQKAIFQHGDTTDRRTLNQLHVESYQHVILVCCTDMDPQQADARTLIALLHLRDIADQAGHSFSIVSEMLDVRNRDLAEVTRADDFIVSDKLISLMMSQISENKQLAPLFEDIFDPEGAEIYLKPAGNYVVLGQPVNFYSIVESARRRGHVAIGYRLQSQAGDADKAYGVVVNPDKSAKVTFGERDRVIVVAED